jgi:hypothetical protein
MLRKSVPNNRYRHGDQNPKDRIIGGGHGLARNRASFISFIKIGAHVMTVLPSAVARKGESLRGENHSYRKGDTH